MKRDEFNVDKVTNEKNGFSVEFGGTQDVEFSFYKDNVNPVKNEVNDNPVHNESKKINDKKDDDELLKRMNNSSSSSTEGTSESASSASSGASNAASGAASSTAAGATAATTATVAGATLVSVAAIATVVGINVFVNAKCEMHSIELAPTMVAYDLDLTDTEEDKFIISLENKQNNYYEYYDLEEGHNAGIFEDLTPNTRYYLAVVDTTSSNYVIYEKDIITPDVTLYDIYFEGGSASGTMENQKVEAGLYIIPECGYVAPDHYRFGGWTIDTESERHYPGEEIEITRSIVLKANWDLDVYNVTFDANGGEGHMDEETYEPGYHYLLPGCEFDPPENYEFGGWMIDEEGEIYSPEEEIEITKDIKLIAYWIEITYELSFDANDGLGYMDADYVSRGSTYILPECSFTKEHCNFTYWTISTSSDGQYAPGDEITVNDNIVITANYEAFETVVTFISNVDTIPDMESQIVPVGTEIEIPEPNFDNPPYYEFSYWDVNGDYKQYEVGSTVIAEGASMVIGAHWSIRHVQLTLAKGDGRGEDQAFSLYYQDEYVLPECPFTAPSGKMFTKWMNEETGEYLEAGESYYPSKTTVFIAIYENYYTVTFHPNGGTGEMEADIVIQGKTYTFPASLFTAPEHQEFMGWTVNESTDVYTEEDTMVIVGDMDLYAMWKYITYTITFNGGGMEGEMSPETYPYGTTIMLSGPEYEAPDGYHFAGWKLDGTDTIYDQEEEITIEGDMSLTALWEKDPYIITFTPGSGEGQEFILETDSAGKLTIPSCSFLPPDGTVFYHWLEDTMMVDALTFTPNQEVTFTSDMTLIAQYQTAHTITYHHTDELSHEAQKRYRLGEVVTLPSPDILQFEVPAGYHYAGWLETGATGEITYAPGDTLLMDRDYDLTLILEED